MQSPQISILIPIYNVEKHIEKCIYSLLNQTIKEQIEIIFVNDCTPDKSIDILKSIVRKNPPRPNITTQILHHEKNRGQAVARLTALNHAKGEYIIYIDSDDYIDNDMIEKMYKRAKETDADITMVDVYKEFENNKLIVKSPYSCNKNDIIAAFIRGTSIYLCNKLIKKDLFINFSNYFKEGYNMSEDYAIMIPLSFEANKIEYVPNTYYHYIQYNSEATTKRRITQREINSWLYSVKCMESYINCNNLKGFEKDVLYRKLIVKYWCISNTRKKEQKYYSSIYPELDNNYKCVIEKITGRKNKLLFYFVLKGHINLFNIYSLIIKYI